MVNVAQLTRPRSREKTQMAQSFTRRTLYHGNEIMFLEMATNERTASKQSCPYKNHDFSRNK